MFGRFIRWARGDGAQTGPGVPDGRRIYAVGDIHGRVDLLRKLHAKIEADAAGAAVQPVVVYLGDYVDRGLDSKDVLALLLEEPLAGFEHVHLLGNHEAMMLDFVEEGRNGAMWLHNGGNATVYSYGIPVPVGLRDDADLGDMAARLRVAVPSQHMSFLNALRLYHVEGDYAFVHAGLRPGRPLEQQDAADMIWIRDRFLEAVVDFGKVVVHGHSISYEVDEKANRIGIDTGAYASGRLTCLVLEGQQRRYLNT